MRISYNWLKELTGLDWPVEEAARRLTLCGTAAEEIEPSSRYMDRVVVGEVVELRPIDGASQIQLARVNIDSQVVDSVCGAPNVAVGQRVPVALAGARLAGDIEMKPTRIRGVDSAVMICSERELGISQDHTGIMVLDRDAPVGTPLARHLQFDDYVITFELTPNRPDSMSAIGIARDLAALASTQLVYPEAPVTEVTDQASDHIKVVIDDPDGCPRYAARVVRNVKLGPSPWWMKARLLMSGIRPISNVVDITNYVLLECGHPLHAFDLDRFGSSRVVVRRARDSERFTTLDEREHRLTPDVLLITNGDVAVAAGGVMGGLNSEVADSTTTILLEAAYFDPAVIRKSRQVLDTVTESSARFEKGADPNGIAYAINRAAYLMQELCGGEVLAGIVDCYPKKIKPKVIAFRPARCNAVLGTSIDTERMKQILTSLQMGVSDSDPIQVTVPTFRPDVQREIDLIEEVARIEGYQAIPDAITNLGPLFTPRDNAESFRSQVRRILTGAGFDEALSHGLANGTLSERLFPGRPWVRLLNSVSQELDIMRNSLVPGLLAVIGHNVAHRNLDLLLFEIGTEYYPPDDQDVWWERQSLALAVTGSTETSWRDNRRLLDFYDITGALERLSEHFRWSPFRYEQSEVAYLDGDISFSIRMADKSVGTIGRVQQSLLDDLDVKQTIYLADIDLEALMQERGPEVVFQPLALYPAAPRDLAIVVDRSVPAGDLLTTVQDSAGELAESVRIFDLYAGKQIARGKKSVAITISYRSSEGSLSSEQVDELQKRVILKLKQKFNAEIRDK